MFIGAYLGPEALNPYLGYLGNAVGAKGVGREKCRTRQSLEGSGLRALGFAFRA